MIQSVPTCRGKCPHPLLSEQWMSIWPLYCPDDVAYSPLLSKLIWHQLKITHHHYRATKCDVIILIQTPATLQLAPSHLFCIAF